MAPVTLSRFLQPGIPHPAETMLDRSLRKVTIKRLKDKVISATRDDASGRPPHLWRWGRYQFCVNIGNRAMVDKVLTFPHRRAVVRRDRSIRWAWQQGDYGD